MSALLLAPYNDSMRLGAGYNSFLQTPCLGNAVIISDAAVITNGVQDFRNGTSQTVAYSSSFVEKMSEVVRSMNISSASSIRTGSVNTTAGNSTIDEAKFSESDLNAVLSVKVVNQTRTIQDEVTFNPLKMDSMDSETFHSVYGDTYISGFIEGGDLYGIVSIKILDSSRKQVIKRSLKSQFNGASSEWSQTSSGELNSLMSETETTISVNYSGGGMIKASTQEWTLESLMATASAFPDNVATCPQRTSAILSRYNTVPSFVEWMNKLSPLIQVRRYDGVQRFTSELLDTFIEYKSNLLILNDAIRHPQLYLPSSTVDAVPLNLKDMVEERRKIKSEMEKMVNKIELLDKDPSQIHQLIAHDDIVAPEVYRARLPTKRNQDEEKAAEDVIRNLLGGLNMVDGSDGNGTGANGTSDLVHNIDMQELRTKYENLQAQFAAVQQSLELKEKELKESEIARKAASDESAALSKRITESDQQQAGLKGDHAGEIEKLKKEYGDEIEKLKSEHGGQIEKLNKELGDQIQGLKTDLSSAKSDYQNMKAGKNAAEERQRSTENDLNVANVKRKEFEDLWNAVPDLQIVSVMIEKNVVGEYVDHAAVHQSLTRHIQNRTSDTLISPMWGGEDPHQYCRKYLRVIYNRKGVPQRAQAWEGDHIRFYA